MLPIRILFVLSLIAVCVPASAWGQTNLSAPATPEPLPVRSYPLVTTAEAAREIDPERRVITIASPMIPDPDTYPGPPLTASPQPRRFITDVKLDYTSVPGANPGEINMTDIEIASTWNFDLALAPLKVTPYAAAHLWNIGDANPFLYLYDLNVEFAWRPRLAEWLFADLAITPGLYTDFKHVTGDSFQMRGRAAAIVACSERLQFVGGAMYVNRNQIKVLPAGGVIWNPSEDTRFSLVFPQPKISHRLCNVGNAPLWAYLAGEFGGGRWEVEGVRGGNDSLDYTDIRVLAGLEWGEPERLRGHLEFGYVFNRRENFQSTSSDVTLPSTAMVRVGFRY